MAKANKDDWNDFLFVKRRREGVDHLPRRMIIHGDVGEDPYKSIQINISTSYLCPVNWIEWKLSDSGILLRLV